MKIERKMKVDATDQKILIELQSDSSQSLDEIARKVNSSKTPVWNRIRKMKGEIRDPSMKNGIGTGPFRPRMACV